MEVCANSISAVLWTRIFFFFLSSETSLQTTVYLHLRDEVDGT